jgi:HEPN domain-containing protein
MSPDFRAYFESWLEKAMHDLESAHRPIEIEPMVLDNACFHCQQAIEKYLKAFLIYNRSDIERTHDIIFLLSECEKFDGIFASIDPMNINAFAVQVRYLDTNILPTPDEARNYYTLAKQIRDLVTERIRRS